MGDTYYLSDLSHSWFKKMAGREDRTLGQYIEKYYVDWVAKRPVVDASVEQLIEERSARMSLQYATVVERNDERVPAYQAPALYDGVVWQAVFGAWRRRPRVINGISEDCEYALAEWIETSAVVRRRAATTATLASQALELIGRGWIK